MKNGFILEYCATVTLNINDVFCPGGDAEEVSIENLESIISLEKEFGSEGVLAYVAIKRGIDNFKFYCHKRNDKFPTLQKAMKKVEELIKNKKIDTLDWSRQVNKRLHELGLIPKEDELLEWFYEE